MSQFLIIGTTRCNSLRGTLPFWRMLAFSGGPQIESRTLCNRVLLVVEGNDTFSIHQINNLVGVLPGLSVEPLART